MNLSDEETQEERDDGGHSDADHSDSGHSSDKLDRFRAHVKKEIELFRGREAETFADHFMAVLTGRAAPYGARSRSGTRH